MKNIKDIQQELKNIKSSAECALEDIEYMISTEKPKLELEDENTKPLSLEGWYIEDGVLTSPNNDAWQIEMEDGSKEFFFTWDAGNEEAERQGKRIPTDEEWDIILENEDERDKLFKTCNFPGYRLTNGTFYNRGSDTTLWSSTEYDASNAWRRTLYYNNSTVYRNDFDKDNGFSVRCLKN